MAETASGREQTDRQEIHEPESLKFGSTRRSEEFTTENFKVEVTNLPRNIKYHAVKQIFERYYKIDPHKIRMGDRRAYLAFNNSEQRDEAIEKISKQEWKGRVLVARQAVARTDPLVERIKGERTEETEEFDISEESVISRVCPLWDREYDQQIDFKTTQMKSILSLAKKILKISPELKKSRGSPLYSWLMKTKDGPCCQFDGVVRSPQLNGYRNKCEFNVGRDGTVGFKMGRYRDGSDRVARPPTKCPIISSIMFEVLDKFQHCLNKMTHLRGYDHVTHEGHVRQLTLRTNKASECLAIVDLTPQNLSEVDVQSDVSMIVQELSSIKEVVSIYVNISESNNFSEADRTLKLMYGMEHLFETLDIYPDKPLSFRIGPRSFFQVNSRAAELLYRSIGELAKLDGKTAVLDIGCGTGTIGLSVASQVSFVVGIDIVSSAVEDARKNAELNKIENVLFFAGKAEDLVGEAMSILKSKLRDLGDGVEIVAIVDPPRVGFNSSFIKFIRASTIQKIIYIACDAQANENLVALCRPPSKAYKGDPFVPTRAKAFDLFPHTKFCELVLVYERLTKCLEVEPLNRVQASRS